MLVKDKFIMVSGIGPGLGVKLAIHAAIEGAAGVAIGARSAEKLEDAERRIRELGTGCKIVPVVTDIREVDQCRAFAQAAINAFGRIDALINNAVYRGPLGDGAVDSHFEYWPEEFAVNVIGTMKMTQAVLPQMKQQGGGAVVMISNMGVKMSPMVDEVGYNSTKAALYNVTRKLAGEVGPDNIRVNSLHPGFMWGVPVQNAMPLFAKDWGGEEKALEKIKQYQALRRIVKDDEVARAGLFLASDYSSAMTGASVDANGGAFMP